MISSPEWEVGGGCSWGKEEITGKEKWKSDGGTGGIPQPAVAHGYIFTMKCEHTPLLHNTMANAQPWREREREGGKIKHGSLCLRVRWKTQNGMTGRSWPWDVLRDSTALVGDRSRPGWHGQLVTRGGDLPGLASQSHTQRIKSHQTRCKKMEGLVNVKSGLRLSQPPQCSRQWKTHTLTHIYIDIYKYIYLKTKGCSKDGAMPSVNVSLPVVLRGSERQKGSTS